MREWKVLMRLVVLGAHVRVLIPINHRHSNTNFAQTSTIFILVKVGVFMFMVKRPFVLTSAIQLNISTLSNL